MGRTCEPSWPRARPSRRRATRTRRCDRWERATTSGSSTATNASRSPSRRVERSRRRRQIAGVRCPGPAAGRQSRGPGGGLAAGQLSCRLRRAIDQGRRSHQKARRTCRAVRRPVVRAGLRALMTTWRAIPTASASTASASGSPPAWVEMIGFGPERVERFCSDRNVDVAGC